MDTRRLRVQSAVGLLAVCLSACTQAPAQGTSGDVTLLDQGWKPGLRHLYYYTPQGSRLIPYDWALALEQPDSEARFFDPAHMQALGYLPSAGRDALNPDDLPIGFVRDKVARDDDTGVWLGLTCSACHTNEMTYRGTRIRVDGAPTLADFQTFLYRLADSVEATLGDEAKFARFAAALGEEEEGADALRSKLDAYARSLDTLMAQNHTHVAYGYGRLDAFGYILNAVSAAALDEPDNARPPSAPTSYPFLWLAPKLEWVQWNGVAANPIGRNAGEVLGTFGEMDLTGDGPGLFTSSVLTEELFEIESWLDDLAPPPWPEAVFGPLDREKVRAGEALFAQHCEACHNAAPFEMTSPRRNVARKQFVRVALVPVAELGTDPAMVDNFEARTAKTGALADRLFDGREEVPAGEMLIKVVGAVVGRDLEARGLRTAEKLEYAGYRLDRDCRPESQTRESAYKAGPLAGVWATAPFLHNGSVPSLYELLSPQEERSAEFWVGDREFDPVKVGYRATAGELTEEERAKLFRFDTALPGNRNTGHHYPKDRALSHDERMALIEYLKGAEAGEVSTGRPLVTLAVGRCLASRLKERYLWSDG